MVDDCHLMISSVDAADTGNYTCYVSNVAATKSLSVALNVAGPYLHVAITDFFVATE